MNKHIKIFEGHNVLEWDAKYQKKIRKGQFKSYDREEDLPDYANYWKIGNRYYQVPTKFEWYTKSLRKSKGLTIALTCTSIAATFFLVSALVQSQVKWNEEQGYSISFYAGEGTFSKGAKSKVVNGIKKGTKLKDVKGYSSCIPTRDDYDFVHWFVDDGTETIKVDDETKITSNLSLTPYFELNPREPKLFGGYGEDYDSWETVLSVIRQGKDVFIDTYCQDFLKDYPDREVALLHFMDSPMNWRTLSVGGISDYGVRLIGIGQDRLDSSEKPLDRELFTFEFNECVTSLPYLYTQGGTPFYTKSGSKDPEEPNEYCGLKTFTEDIVYNQLPLLMRENIKTVTKRTLQVHGGFNYTYYKPLQSYQFDRSCLNSEVQHLEMVETPEKLFSLSLDEIGATKYNFNYIVEGEEKDGRELMKETTQFTSDEIKDESETPILNTFGEGFQAEGDSHDFTESYQFYSHEWYNPDDHTDEFKRMKRYFIGAGDKSINSTYHLRSIYIPNKYDVDAEDKSKASGNKDYRPFETWNITDTGTIGNCKISGQRFDDQQKYFGAGDMAWVSAFVAPAFCL